jgi:non-ribosomal peptide synthetase component E (peptide arylation enzyme)
VIARHQNATLTYQDLDVQSDALARGLERQGVQKGDRVAVMLGNSVEYCVVRTVIYEHDQNVSDINHRLHMHFSNSEQCSYVAQSDRC